MSQTAAQRCPIDHDAPSGDRRAVTGRRPGPAVERVDGGWVIRSADVAREVLRDGQDARQAGFSAEAVSGTVRAALPLLYNYGDSHRRQRASIARFFAPKVVDTAYRGIIEREVQRVVATVAAGGPVSMDRPLLRFSVAVARQVVGLTESRADGMARRLGQFLGHEVPVPGTAAAMRYQVMSLLRLGLFHVWDVRPAISARRHRLGEDVLSLLVEQGASDAEILMEAITYGVAGMVTTREFIAVALWHLLRNDELRRQYTEADQAGRYAILNELLRVEPVVGSLFRRLHADMTVEHEGTEYRFAQGDLIQILISETNLDESVVGECPADLRPGRTMAHRHKDDVLGFGEGPHRCPGLFLAIQESDMLLSALLELPLELVAEPEVTVDPLIESLVVRGLTIRLAR